MAKPESTTDIDLVSAAEVEHVLNLPACIEKRQLRELEQVAACRALGFHRRVTFGVLSMSVRDLIEASTSKPEAYGDIVESVDAFKQHAEALLEFATVAKLRLSLADGRASAGDVQ